MDSKDKLEIYKELQRQLEERKKKQVVFQHNNITVEVDVINGWIYADWTGAQTQQSVEDGCMQILEAMEKYHVHKILNDNTRIQGNWTGDVKWISGTWFPQMISAGMKKFAWIYSPGELHHISADQTIREITPSHSIRSFDSIEEGKRWLNGEESAMPGNGNTF